MTGKKVRYAVVGGGQISQQAFMPGVGQTSNSELAALVTGDPVKAEKLAEKYGINAWSYDEYAALLKSGEIDAVYVATPNARHTQLVVEALEAGIHVLLEKPMTSSVEDAEKVLEAQKASSAKLMIAYRLHHEPGTVEMFTRARNGDFGALRAFTSTFAQNVAEENSRGHNGYWGGPVPDMGTYPLNAVRNLFGEEPVAVHAVGTKAPDRGFDFHDTVAVTLRFPSERTAQFTVSYATAAAESFTLVGTKATIYASPCFMFGPKIGISYVEKRDDCEKTHSFDPVEQFGNETQYFSDCILNDCDPEADGEEGIMDMRVLAAVETSLETGETVVLPPAQRSKRVSKDQALNLTPAKEPTEDEMISIVPQSK
ncbi:Gfo/Idh/MocA family protein [Agrobacterium tumefaciens]|uniref:Gfo/Idh/MocA family oxidoreductase n=1 Tax=Agrobacterium tumefaciens TaxID=358 RepID=A0AA44F5D3_AGRTU|nr:Gfo/Idh/MocA family oxidoreductase [Agrobacterium tumefaciens]NTB87544.1 Gfo/Idh/MocA family oxidoreductase [Agrobacterium tumefaciens]NTC17529.1 Gfo/Idh/MocA family oxidoreductase [Agrobacterium tumefaciens]NTC29689.1 Gfo/Idh/MocA family oxidoreductase [Agrobacterium tumefaciens]